MNRFNSEKTWDFIMGVLLGILFSLIFFVIIAQSGPAEYTIGVMVTENGIEYTVYHETWVRKDPIYVTMNELVAWTVWSGMYANRAGVNYEIQEDTPDPYFGSCYNKDCVKRKINE